MAYAIGNIIYGINLTHSPYDSKPDKFADFRSEISDLMGGHEVGFDGAYSGSGDSNPEWFGETMGEFDECNDLTGAKMIALCTPSDDHRVNYAEMLDKLRASPNVSEGLKSLIEGTEPAVYIVWGTS